MISVRKPKNSLIMTNPSSWWGCRWRTAMPLGNGVIGASVFGGASEDVVMLNHSDLWWQGRDSVLQDVSDKLKDVRKKLDDGLPIEAQSILADELIRKNFRPQEAYPLPLVDFKISMPIDRSVKEYARVLNMEAGEATVTYKDDATRYERSCFVSRARNLFVYEITRSGPHTIDATLSFDLQDKFNARTATAISALPDGAQSRYEPYFMYFSARSSDGSDYGAVAKINFLSGKQVVTDGGVRITGTEKILVIITPFVGIPKDKAFKTIRAELSDVKLPYDKLLKEHSAIHSRLFSASEVDLPSDERATPIEELLNKTFTSGELSTALTEKLWAFGRYLFISGTSPDSRMFAPYGLWCGDFKGANAQVNAAGSLQNAYSFACAGSLADFNESVFHTYEALLDDLRKNASRLYGCRGIYAPAVTSPSTGVVGRVTDEVINFTGVAAMISRMFYDYYLYTGDAKFLKTRALPFMKENVTFYEEFFKIRDEAFYESSPATSLGTTPGNLTSVGGEHPICKNPTIDYVLARNLITDMIEGSEAAGLYKSEIAKWKDMLTKIPGYKIGNDGCVCEFVDSDYTDNPAAPSLGLVYAVYPGANDVDNGDEAKAFVKTARNKLLTARKNMDATALASYANVLARLGEGQAAMDVLESLVTGMAMDNLVMAGSDWRGMGSGKHDVWAAPQAEANLAFTNAVYEMIIQSDKKSIKLLPAMSSAVGKGSVTNVLTKTGVTVVNLDWDIDRGNLSVKLKASKNTKIDLQLPKGAKPPKKLDAESFDIDTARVINLNLPNGKTVQYDFKF